MSRPVVLVVASPYVDATVLGRLLEERGRYEVVVPDLGAGEEVPPVHFDAVLTTLPVPDAAAPVVIELPWSWETPVRVRVHDVKRELQMTGSDPIADVLELLERSLSASDPLEYPAQAHPR